MSLPRVSSILKDAGLVNEGFYTDFARDRGAAVHAACALGDLGNLDESTLHPEVEPYVRSWRLLRDHMGWKFGPGDVELEVSTAAYVGHPDKVLRTGCIVREVLDLKTGQPEPWHAIQLAMYAMAFVPSQAVYPGRLGIYLSGEGKIGKSYRYTDPNDFFVAKAAITLAAWKNRQGERS